MPKAFDSADDKTKAMVKQLGKALYSPHSLGLAWVVPVGDNGDNMEGIHKLTCRRMFETVFVPVIGIPNGCFRAAAVFGDSARYKKTAPLIADMLITQVGKGEPNPTPNRHQPAREHETASAAACIARCVGHRHRLHL